MKIFPRSNFQSGIFLVLIVAAPVLVYFIFLYLMILADVVHKNSGKCFDLCSVSVRTPDLFIPIRGVKKKRQTQNQAVDEYANVEYEKENTLAKNLWKKKRKRSLQNRHFKHIGALIEDSRQSTLIFLYCPVALVANNLALTTGYCIENPQQVENLQIRIGSKYWWKNGILKDVKQLVTKKISKSEHWLAIVFEHLDDYESEFYHLLTMPDYNHNSTWSGKVYFWDDLYKPLQERTVEIVEVNNNLYDNNTVEIYNPIKSYNCNDSAMDNAPIVYDGVLMGIHLNHEEKENTTICYYVNTFQLHHWFRQS